MTIITVSRAATPDEISAEMDRRGAAIEHLETNLRHWREEYGKLHAQLDLLRAEVRHWRECAHYDVTMGGAIFAGRWNRSALDRCRRYAEEHPLDDDESEEPGVQP